MVNLKHLTMKKINAIGITFILLILGSFISCDKNKEENTINLIVGTWEYEESSEGFSMTVTLTFNSDNTGVSKIEIVYDGIPDTETSNFTYQISGNKLTVNEDGDISEVTYSISGDKLTITEDGYDMVFTKK